jgi:hypothetical protein
MASQVISSFRWSFYGIRNKGTRVNIRSTRRSHALLWRRGPIDPVVGHAVLMGDCDQIDVIAFD